jgi:uncharacterized membrane protein YgcG
MPTVLATEVGTMERTKAMWTALYSWALSLWVLPALALAQSSQGSQPGSGASPAGGTPSSGAGGSAGTGGGSGWLWIIAAIVVLAIIWWAMSSRRRHGTVTR